MNINSLWTFCILGSDKLLQYFINSEASQRCREAAVHFWDGKMKLSIPGPLSAAQSLRELAESIPTTHKAEPLRIRPVGEILTPVRSMANSVLVPTGLGFSLSAFHKAAQYCWDSKLSTT